MTQISEVSIANGALTYLGDKTIISLTDDSNQARACNARYEHIRDAVTRSHPWNSAVTRINIAKTATTPVFQYTGEFILPTDPYCLRVLLVEDYSNTEWTVEGRYLYADASSLNIKYIKRITDPMDMDALLVEAISARLAHSISFRLTSDRNLRIELWQTYQQILREARSIDGQEGAPPVIKSETFTDIRL